MWALIVNGLVYQLFTSDPGLPPAQQVVDVSTVTGIAVGWIYANGTFSAPTPPSTTAAVPDLINYAEKKQTTVLDALSVGYTLKDGTATLTTLCDSKSITFLNSLASWASMNAATSPVPTRVYYNLDGSSHALNPAQMAEFLNFVGARVQATFDALATVRSDIGISPATITTFAGIDAFAWPTS